MSDLTFSVSLSRKINLGNYESADVFVSVSGATAETTQEEVTQLLSNRIVWDALKDELGRRVNEVKGNGAKVAAPVRR